MVGGYLQASLCIHTYVRLYLQGLVYKRGRDCVGTNAECTTAAVVGGRETTWHGMGGGREERRPGYETGERGGKAESVSCDRVIDYGP